MGLSAADLGDGEALAIAVAHRAQPGEEIGDLGLALVVEMALEIERPRADMAVVGRGRIVAQRGVAHREVDRVASEARSEERRVGKHVSVSVALGGSRSITKKKYNKNKQ